LEALGLRGKANHPGDGMLKLSQLQGYVSWKVKDHVAKRFDVAGPAQTLGNFGKMGRLAPGVAGS